MAQTTTTQVDPAVATMYDRLLLMRARPHLIHTLFGQRRDLRKKSGNTIKFRRYTNLSVATTPIGEGVTPAGSQLAKTDLTAVVSQYGRRSAVVKPLVIDLEALTLNGEGDKGQAKRLAWAA